jgi:hypothetical protein
MVKKDRAALTAAALIAICLPAGALRANIAIKPAFVEVNMDEGRPSGMFLVSNLGDKEERFRVNALYFSYSEEGALKKSQAGDYSLAAWIRFNPRELTLAPGTQRAVRFAIVPRAKLTEGEYWAAMELESLAVNEVLSKDEKSGRSVKLKVLTTIVAPIFGTVGKTSYAGKVEDVQVDVENGAIVLKTLVAATGNGRLGIKGNYELVDTAGNVVDSGPFGAGYIFRGCQRWFNHTMGAKIPKGEYTARISIEAPHLEQPIVKEVPVTWPELPPAPTETGAGPVAPSVAGRPAASVQSSADEGPQRGTEGSAGTK